MLSVSPNLCDQNDSAARQHTQTDACCVWAQLLSQTCRSIGATAFSSCDGCCFHSCLRRGLTFRDENSCAYEALRCSFLWRSAPWHPDSEQLMFSDAEYCVCVCVWKGQCVFVNNSYIMHYMCKWWCAVVGWSSGMTHTRRAQKADTRKGSTTWSPHLSAMWNDATDTS